MSYKQAYKDHKYLFDIGFADDMTGGYVDSEDLKRMLKNPNKSTAEMCLDNQIRYWFQVGTEGGLNPISLVDEYPKIQDIADRYCINIIEDYMGV